MIRKTQFVFIASVILLFTPACVNLKPAPSQTVKYALGPVEMAAQQPRGRTSGESVFIIRPQVPSYLVGMNLSYRLASGEVRGMPGVRWAEPLPEGIARAMSVFLSESSPGMVEAYYPGLNTSPEASRLALYFQRFDATESGEVQVAARWTLKRPGGNSQTGQYVSEELSWFVGQPETLVAAFNRALQGLAVNIEKSVTDY